METYLQPLVAYFSAHPELALAAVFGASFLEALAIVGTFVPGSSVVFVAGTLIGLHALDFWPTFSICVVGAVGGEAMSRTLLNA